MLLITARGFPWSRAWASARRPLARGRGGASPCRGTPQCTVATAAAVYPASVAAAALATAASYAPQQTLRWAAHSCQLALGLVGRASLAALVVARPTARRHVAALAVRLLLLILVVMTCILVAPLQAIMVRVVVRVEPCELVCRVDEQLVRRRHCSEAAGLAAHRPHRS